MTTLEKEIGFLVGIPIDYYAAVDLEGFRDMVDAVGGVDIDNPRAVDDPFTGTEMPAGPVHLDGHNALKYVRSREGVGDSDYTRAGRQQLVLVALERKVASPAVLPKLSALISQAGKIDRHRLPAQERPRLRLGRPERHLDIPMRARAALQLPSPNLDHGRGLDQPAGPGACRQPLGGLLRLGQPLLRAPGSRPGRPAGSRPHGRPPTCR